MRLGTGRAAPAPSGTRVLLDVRPLQDPQRAPVTAAYLGRLLAAFAANPLAGESFVPLLDLGAEDPMVAFAGLPLAGRRRLPPTRIFRSGALTLDPFFVRAAGLGAGRGAAASGAAGVVAHAVAGALPIGPGLPVVATLLDLASWELPEQYRRSPAARFGQRLRGQLLRDAALVLVAGDAVAAAAVRLLRLRPARVRIVSLAGDDALHPPEPAGTPEGDTARARLATERERFGLPERYFVYPGRYDARQDLGTLLAALGRLGAAGRPARLAKAVAWPPRVLVLGASPDDRASLARQAFEAGVGDALAFAPGLSPERAALLRAGARASLHPVLADSAALPVLDALAMGTPIVGSAVGAVPEAVGSAGLLVPPRDPDRLAAALRAAWAEERVHRAIAEAAAARAAPGRRTWADVARGTREAYAAAARRLEP
jgi:glycosyltransferase involved in cell wall biosynthesis